jgi:hypothetical protein
MEQEMLHEKEVFVQQHKSEKEYSDGIRVFFHCMLCEFLWVFYLDVYFFL